MLTSREWKIRESLQDRKPLVYKKILDIPEKIKRKECVALIQFQYNYACNLKCEHCAIERFKRKEKTLSISDVKSIADQADKMGLMSICITGGEPLIFPDLKDVIEAIGPERFNISVDTNGHFLKDKVKWLIDSGVDRVHLSLDGLEDNHNQFRKNNDSWGKCMEALKACHEHGLGVIVNIVATKSIVESGELVRQLEFLKELNTFASIIYAKPIGAFENAEDEILDTKDLDYIQSLTKKYNCSTHLSTNCGHEFGCLCIKRQFSITAYGDVLPCPWIPITLGNIHTEPLEEIVNRALKIKWFSYDNKSSCFSGNKDTYFYKNIMPQIKDEYPADWRNIKWD